MTVLISGCFLVFSESVLANTSTKSLEHIRKPDIIEKPEIVFVQKRDSINAKPDMIEKNFDIKTAIREKSLLKVHNNNFYKSLSALETNWRSSFELKYFNDDTTNTAITRAKIYAQLNWELSQSLSFYSQAVFIGLSGTTTSIYDRLDRQSGLHMLSAFFTYKRAKFFSIDFGNIQQTFLKAPFLVTDKTFSSIKLNLNSGPYLKKGPSVVGVLHLAIPSNTEQTQRRRQIIKGVPLFAVLALHLKNKQLSFLSFDPSFFNYFNLWAYYNLPPSVAYASNIYGNSIQGQGADSVFKYDYYGLHNHSGLKAVFSANWAGDMGLEYIKNLGSPSGISEGARIYTSLYYNYQNFVELKGTLEYFKNQSNSAVAFYNSEVYGHNNRKGFLARLQFYFYESRIRAGLSVVSSKPVLSRAAIGPSLSASIFLTTNYLKIN